MYIDAMKNNVNAFLKIDYASLGGNNSSSDGVKEKTISISQFGGYDIKTVVTYKDDKVTDLAVTGENFKGKFAKQNENDYLPKAVNKIDLLFFFFPHDVWIHLHLFPFFSVIKFF